MSPENRPQLHDDPAATIDSPQPWEVCSSRVVCATQVVRPPAPDQPRRGLPASVWDLGGFTGEQRR